MREIEFRGKVSADVQVGDVTYLKGMWIYGSLCTNSPVSIIPHDMNVFIEVDEDSVGQFTGLTDKDGDKIFEGDFLDHPKFSVAYCGGNPDDTGMKCGFYIQRDNFESWTELECRHNVNGDNYKILKNDKERD